MISFSWTIAACVAFGGAVGALLRAAFLRLGQPSWRFPYATLTVNTAGSFLIGCGSALSDPLLAAWLMSGLLGGFTTYSTFAVEAATMKDAGHSRAAFVYALLTLLSSALAAGLGAAAARALAATVAYV